MDNPHPPGNRPMSVAPDPGRGRTPEPDAPRGRRYSLADVLAAVMLLLATLTYLGRLVWGLSQPGYEIQARDFGSLLAAIIAIPAGVLLVTGMKPAVGRLTGALGAGAMLLFNAVNLTGGSVDDVIGKYGTWAAIPIVVATAIAIVALYRASWSPEVRIVAADSPRDRGEEFVARQRENEFDSPRYQNDYTAQARSEDRPLLPSRSAPVAEQADGVIGAPPAPREPVAAEASSLEPSEQIGPAISALPAPERPRDEAPQDFSASGDRATTADSALNLPEMSLPEPGPVEAFAPESALPPRDRESGFGASGAGSAPHPQQPAPAGAPRPAAPEPYVPERLASRPAESDAGGPVPPQQGPGVAAQTPATEPFAQPDPALFHAATDGIPAVPHIDPPTTVLPRPDFTANPQQARPPVAEPQQPGPVIGAPPAGSANAEPDRHDGFRTPPPFPPPGGEPQQPGHVIAPNVPAPETAPLNMRRPGTPQPPAGPPRSEVPSGPPRNGFGDSPAPYQGNPQQGNPPQGSGPLHQPFGPPQNTPYALGGAPQNSLRLPGTEAIPNRAAPAQPVLRRPGGFLAPPPVEPEPAPGWSPPGSGQPHPDGGRPQLHDVSASEHPGSRDPQPPHAEQEAQPPAYLDHRQSPPKRLAPPPWAQEQ
ncbi:hypothetical protein [Nocardia vaccinii]|uniref:hypothetical protein n=1 Tax=Nocardia vaccinii TaxID=1822 RepID=UPI000AF51E6B|nr:hypothetical protein [Nocardia vaccinii]